ncbi:uncharacterized protein LOC110447488 [Mizuhopecten yessoensis]|uniref:uncharacterized protein LOC110447488 n=1 Tax=Mizuhopecten yessoensis TaxID=6573 RepID=UPI000B45C863|nr:uncharacterized protein LOC110447488 [Mizuhopecten yessoensis]
MVYTTLLFMLLATLSLEIVAMEHCYFYDDALFLYGYYGSCEYGCCGSPESQTCCNKVESDRTGWIIGVPVSALVVGACVAALCYFCRSRTHCIRHDHDESTTTEQALVGTERSTSDADSSTKLHVTSVL